MNNFIHLMWKIGWDQPGQYLNEKHKIEYQDSLCFRNIKVALADFALKNHIGGNGWQWVAMGGNGWQWVTMGDNG